MLSVLINLDDNDWTLPFRGGMLTFSRKIHPLEVFSKIFSEVQELCGRIRIGIFLRVEKRPLRVWIGATRFFGQLNRAFFMPFFLNSCSRIFFSKTVSQEMLTLTRFADSLGL